MEIGVDIKPDKEGYTGRECPVCEKYFKIKSETGIKEVLLCHCPYCNHVATQDQFWTKQQIEYAKSVALNLFTKQLISDFKKMEWRTDPKALISIGITVKGNPTPLAYYSEKELEERVVCDNCALNYSIYGTFGFCPDCGVHNSLQISKITFDYIIKIIELTKDGAPEILNRIIENALEDAVSCFDGFGREHCKNLSYRVSFQNIEGAKERLLQESGFDISASMSSSDWHFVCEQFQKRHLIAHKLSIIDAEYVSKTGVSKSMIGRKIIILEQDVRKLVLLLIGMAETLYQKLPPG